MVKGCAVRVAIMVAAPVLTPAVITVNFGGFPPGKRIFFFCMLKSTPRGEIDESGGDWNFFVFNATPGGGKSC